VVKPKRTILAVLFPDVRAKLLQLLFSMPLKQRYVRELMNITGLALHTVQDELRKLTAVGLVTSWSNGYHRFYRANGDHPLFAHLLQIVQASAKLPKIKHSALHRQARRRGVKKPVRGRPRPLPVDRPARWQLFTEPPKARRL
jgi:hypothetical protein